jgi:hypothetical protein
MAGALPVDNSSTNSSSNNNSSTNNDLGGISDQENTESLNILFGLYSILSNALKKQLDEQTLRNELSAINMPEEYSKTIIETYSNRYIYIYIYIYISVCLSICE